MARRRGRRRHGGGMSSWRKWARLGVGLSGKLIGAGIALSPTFRGLQQVFKGDVTGGFDSIAFDTTGAIPSKGQPPGLEIVARTAVTVVAGVLVMKLFGFVARRI